jgi:uncharacterized protein (TIGR04141 family)
MRDTGGGQLGLQHPGRLGGEVLARPLVRDRRALPADPPCTGGATAGRPAIAGPAPWDTTWAERDYNDWVPLNRAGYVCLDRRGIRGGLHRRSGAQVCDLLAPGDELVHVKRAHGSAPLSHLFSQGLVAAEALLCSPDLRARFVAEVRKRGKGRTVPLDFTPKKIVFAILLKDGERLTPETLFPFSQVTLAHTARTLERRGIAVEVIGINTIAQQ